MFQYLVEEIASHKTMVQRKNIFITDIISYTGEQIVFINDRITNLEIIGEDSEESRSIDRDCVAGEKKREEIRRKVEEIREILRYQNEITERNINDILGQVADHTFILETNSLVYLDKSLEIFDDFRNYNEEYYEKASELTELMKHIEDNIDMFDSFVLEKERAHLCDKEQIRIEANLRSRVDLLTQKVNNFTQHVMFVEYIPQKLKEMKTNLLRLEMQVKIQK